MATKRYQVQHNYSSDSFGTYLKGDVIELDDARAGEIERDSPGVLKETTARQKLAEDTGGLLQERPDDNQTLPGKRYAAVAENDRMQRVANARSGTTVEGEVYGDTDDDGDPALNKVLPPAEPSQIEPAPVASSPVGEASARAGADADGTQQADGDPVNAKESESIAAKRAKKS